MKLKYRICNIFSRGQSLYQQIYDLQIWEVGMGGLSKSQFNQLMAFLKEYNINLHLQEMLWKQKA